MAQAAAATAPARALTLARELVDRPADRPLRADHAAGGAGLRHRPPPLGLRALPASAPRGAALRRGGRRRPRARRARGLPLRRRDARGAARRGRRPDAATWLASYRFTGDMWGYPEGEVYLPYSPLLVVEGTFAEAVLLETVLLSIYNHDSAIASAASRMTTVGRRPALHRDGVAAYPRGGRGGGRPGGVRRRLRDELQPRGPAAVRRTDRRHERAQLHPAPRLRGRRLPGPGLLARAPARRCWSTPTTSARPSGLGVEIAGPELGAVRLDSGDLGVARPARCAPSSTTSARPTPGSWSPATSTSTPSPRWPRRRSTRTASGTQLVDRLGAPHLRLRLQAGRPARTTPAPWSRWRRRAPTRSRSGVASTRCGDGRRPGWPRPRWSGIGEPPVDDGDDRSLMVPARARRRGHRPRDRSTQARTRHLAARAELPPAAQQMSRGEPVIPTIHV